MNCGQLKSGRPRAGPSGVGQVQTSLLRIEELLDDRGPVTRAGPPSPAPAAGGAMDRPGRLAPRPERDRPRFTSPGPRVPWAVVPCGRDRR